MTDTDLSTHAIINRAGQNHPLGRDGKAIASYCQMTLAELCVLQQSLVAETWARDAAEKALDEALTELDEAKACRANAEDCLATVAKARDAAEAERDRLRKQQELIGSQPTRSHAMTDSLKQPHRLPTVPSTASDRTTEHALADCFETDAIKTLLAQLDAETKAREAAEFERDRLRAMIKAAVYELDEELQNM